MTACVLPTRISSANASTAGFGAAATAASSAAARLRSGLIALIVAISHWSRSSAENLLELREQPRIDEGRFATPGAADHREEARTVELL